MRVNKTFAPTGLKFFRLGLDPILKKRSYPVKQGESLRGQSNLTVLFVAANRF